MKPYLLRRNSLMYKFLNLGNTWMRDPSDVCEMGRMFIRATFMSFIILATVVVLGSLPVGFIYWAITSIMAGKVLVMNPPGAIFIVLCVAAFLIWCCYLGAQVYHKLDEASIDKQPSFAKTWYQGFKGKFCVRVNCVSEGEE